MSTLSRLCDSALALVKLEVEIGDVYTGYQTGNKILAAAWSRRESLWKDIQHLGKEALAEAKPDARYSAVEKRVSKLVKRCRALYTAGWNIHHRKAGNSEREAKAEGENVRRIGDLSRSVEDAVASLRLLADAPSELPPAAPPPPFNDPTAYRPAKEFIGDAFPTAKAIRKELDANPTIRTRRPIGRNGEPIPNRLEIHAGDWHDFINRPKQTDPLDNPAAIVDAVMEAEGRKEKIRKLKAAGGK